jgi:hypothetical protein
VDGDGVLGFVGVGVEIGVGAAGFDGVGVGLGLLLVFDASFAAISVSGVELAPQDASMMADANALTICRLLIAVYDFFDFFDFFDLIILFHIDISFPYSE